MWYLVLLACSSQCEQIGEPVKFDNYRDCERQAILVQKGRPDLRVQCVPDGSDKTV